MSFKKTLCKSIISIVKTILSVGRIVAPYAVWRGKSGLHGSAVPDNLRLGRPKGKCSRKQTACHVQVRMKRCGKSAPRGWQQTWQGKPHREQNQIGMTRTAKFRLCFQASHPGRLLEVRCKVHPR